MEAVFLVFAILKNVFLVVMLGYLALSAIKFFKIVHVASLRQEAQEVRYQ